MHKTEMTSVSPLAMHQLRGALTALQAAGVPSAGTWRLTDAEGQEWELPLLQVMHVGVAVEQLRRYGVDPRGLA